MSKNKTDKKGGVIINPKCSLNCHFCGSKAEAGKKELKKQELKIQKNLEHFKGKTDMIEISGSDPIEYDKIAELVEHIKKEGFETVRISTHGVNLCDFDLLDDLVEAGVDGFRIPIYGSTPKIHDSVTQAEGSFEKMTSGLKRLKEIAPEIKVQMSCLITKQNKEDLCNIVDYVNDELGVQNFYFSVPCLAQDNWEDFYVPFKYLIPYGRKVYSYAMEVNDAIEFHEIPFCIFGEYNPENILNKVRPPDLGKYNQPPSQHKSSEPDIPAYRVKEKPEMCEGCEAFDNCDGFFVRDIEKFGTEGIEKF